MVNEADVHQNHTYVNGIEFFQTEKALEYRAIAEDLPLTNIPATELIYNLLDPKGEIVLDYGCFQGDSSLRVLMHGAEHVVGVDINKSVIEIAKSKFALYKNMTFHEIDSKGPIPIPVNLSGYKKAYATFVHPTISSIEVMASMMRNLSNVMLPGGQVAFLGLHPNSFYGKHHFNNYAHQLPPSGLYADGTAFPNKLIRNDGGILAFNDYCWTESTMIRLMREAGFSKVEVLGVTTDLKGKAGEILLKAIERVKIERGVDFLYSPEFQVPLYQIFIAVK